MLSHVPFRDVLFAAEWAYKRPKPLVLAQVHIVIGTCVVLLITSLIGAMKLINILVCFFVVSQNPMLSELWKAPRIGANELLILVLLVSGHVIRQVLRHLEALRAVLVSAFVESYRKMTFQMLTKFWIFRELFDTARDGAFERIHEFLTVLTHAHKVLTKELFLALAHGILDWLNGLSVISQTFYNLKIGDISLWVTTLLFNFKILVLLKI